MGKWIVIQNAPGYLRENDARRGRRTGGRHKGDWQPGGGVLPIHRSGDGRRSALLRILSSLSPDLCGTSRCGRSFPPAPGRLSPRRLDDWNIVASNRFVQCNVHMEDMRIAQRGWPSAVPTMDGADPVACYASGRGITFLPASSAKEPQACRSKRGLRAGNGREHFPFDPLKTSVIETPRSGALNLSHGPRISAAFR